MKRRIIWLILSFMMALSLVLASCAEKEMEEEEEEEGVVVEEEEEEEGGPSVTGNWWDKLGEPEYGGTLTLHATSDPSGFDPYSAMMHVALDIECMGGFDRTVSPEHCNFTTGYYPADTYAGWLVESWETTDFATFTFHIHEGVHWHDKPPLNGRELTADDIVYSYHRIMGNGSGFTEPSMFFLSTGWLDLESITATDKYTVVFKFSQSSVQNLLTILEGASANNISATPEAVEQWGQVSAPSWRDVIGTGPFMLDDYVSGASYTYVKNPNYWRYDDRWPENKLPYLDSVKYLIISDYSTALAALRTGKIDRIGGTVEVLSWQKAAALKKSNPEILQSPVVQPANGIQLRVDQEPFTDIKVRTAMQMAMDLPTVAKTYYDNVDWKPWGTAGLTVHEVNNPYDEWPQELQEEYSYNPEGARELLAEAGFPNGFQTTCLTSNTQDLDLLQVMKAYLLDIGIDMEIQATDSSTQRALTNANKYETLFFPMGMAENKPIVRIVGNLYTGYTNNFPRLADPVYDQMYNGWLKSTSWDEAYRLAKEIDMYVIKGHYRVTLMPFYTYVAYQPWLGGYNGEAGQQEVYHIPFFWIKSELKGD